MTVIAPGYLCGPKFLDYLRQVFQGREAITSTEFRKFLHMSPSTDQRMRAEGKYPRTISLPGITRDRRILLVDLAIWLENGGCPESDDRPSKKRGRGSDAWKKSHSKPAASPALLPAIPDNNPSI